MKKLLLLATLLAGYFVGNSQPKVYFDFVTHNEETFQWNNTPYYTLNRAKLISLANYFQANGVSWNMQSDWVYLSNVLSQDSVLMANTNNKNILRWLWEDKGVEMDPHGHETQYIYPDLVKLMDSIGLPESKLMGGTLYNQSNGINIWTNLINGQFGIVFPTKFWQPDYMMGGGTPNHVADLKYYGFWNPQDSANYLTHFPANHLRHIGVGCEMKIKDTTTVSVIVAELQDVVQKVQSGQYPSNGFYLQSIFFEQGDLNNATFYDKVIAVADSVNAIVATGNAEWKTLKQAYTLWETAYAAQMFQWECGVIYTGINKLTDEPLIQIYPNPFKDFATIKIKSTVSLPCEITLYDLSGRAIRKLHIANYETRIEHEHLAGGTYLYKVTNYDSVLFTGKLNIE